jgi:pilus assembly protein CpaF
MDFEDRLRGELAGGTNPRLNERLQSQTESVEGDALLGAKRPQAAGGATDPYAELKGRVHTACIPKLGPRLFAAAEADIRDEVRQVVSDELARETGMPLSSDDRRRLVGEITSDILGYGPLEPFLRDHTVTEVMVNGHDRVYVERAGRIERTDAAFADEDHLLRIIDRIVSQIGRRVDEASPMVDARLPDGSRVNAIVPPLSIDGPTLTIRKFAHDPYTMFDLVELGTVTEQAMEFLAACVAGKLNVLISGGTGTGKTTLLNALSAFIPDEERIITIEDAAELQLQQPHVVRLESRPPNAEGAGEVVIRDLVRNALRMRPDRIIIGEVRSAETLDMLQAMNTGHEGSLTTVHANSPRDALSRLETLVLMSGLELPLHATREQISSALDVIVHLTRLIDGTRRISHITEVLRMESDVITLQDVFVARPVAEHMEDEGYMLLGPLVPTGLQPHFHRRLAANGVTLPLDFFAPDSHMLNGHGGVR